MTIIPALEKLMQEDQEFQASLGLITSWDQPEIHSEDLTQNTKG